MAQYQIGGIPNKGKKSLSTRLYMKWKKIELGCRRWRDPEIRKQMADARERNNPMNVFARKK